MDREVHNSLDRLRTLLDAAGPKKVDLMQSGIDPWNLRPIPPADLPAAQELYRRVVERGGSGSTFVQEGLLRGIALTGNPVNTAFWLEIIDLKKPRDTFAVRRRTYAVAALAFIAIQSKEGARLDPLLGAARHPNPDARSLAGLYLGRVCEQSEGELPSDAHAVLMEMALKDPAFGPRFQARLALETAGESVPLDHEDEVFLFRVRLTSQPDSYRTIAVPSDQTLDHLHFGIQRAFGWDADHLYTFFMNGKFNDRQYAIECPHVEGSARRSDGALIGNLGLVTKHKFLYLSDFGDMHFFEVEMTGIQARSKGARYPCVVEKQGKAPQQYRWE